MAAYIGPERRKGQRRGSGLVTNFGETHDIERRTTERRQEALAGVIAGLTAEDMLKLADLWKLHEAQPHRRTTVSGFGPGYSNPDKGTT